MGLLLSLKGSDHSPVIQTRVPSQTLPTPHTFLLSKKAPKRGQRLPAPASGPRRVFFGESSQQQFCCVHKRLSAGGCLNAWLLSDTTLNGGSPGWGCSSVVRTLAHHAQSPGLDSQHCMKQVTVHVPVIPAPRNWRQESQRSKVILGDIGISRPA